MVEQYRNPPTSGKSNSKDSVTQTPTQEVQEFILGDQPVLIENDIQILDDQVIDQVLQEEEAIKNSIARTYGVSRNDIRVDPKTKKASFYLVKLKEKSQEETEEEDPPLPIPPHYPMREEFK